MEENWWVQSWALTFYAAIKEDKTITDNLNTIDSIITRYKEIFGNGRK